MPERERTQLIDAIAQFVSAYASDPQYADLLPGLEQLQELLVAAGEGSTEDSPGRREAEQAALEAATAAQSTEPPVDLSEEMDDSEPGPDNRLLKRRRR